MSVIHRRGAVDAPTGNETAGSVSLLQRWLQGAIRNWRRRKTVAALVALNDRMLMDIGLERGTIIQFVGALDDRELRMTPPAAAVRPDQAEDQLLRLAA